MGTSTVLRRDIPGQGLINTSTTRLPDKGTIILNICENSALTPIMQ
jgi:hypothetical protein